MRSRLMIILLLLWSPTVGAFGNARQKLRPESAANVSSPEYIPVGESTYKNFSALRLDILNMIGGAGKRIWIYSDLLADAEIAASLYVAKFRKLEILVLLDQGRSRSPLSRLPTLKNQSVTTYLSPDGWKKPAPTAILADERLVYINRDLNPYAAGQVYELHNIGEEDKMSFEANFIRAIGKKIPAVAAERPLVGRGRGSSWRSSERASVEDRSPSYTGEADGSFNYNMVKHSRQAPEGMPRKLPRQTLQQKRQQREVQDALKQENREQEEQPQAGGWQNP